MWDNAPPNPAVAGLIREWNRRGNNPPIRYVTSEELLERIKTIPTQSLPLQCGDWTDYWNFGCASTAYETRLNRRSKPILFTAELLQSARGESAAPPAHADVSRRAWSSLNSYDEHTWGYFIPDPDLAPMRAQARLKQHHAYEAAELADYLLIHELEALAGNPAAKRPARSCPAGQSYRAGAPLLCSCAGALAGGREAAALRAIQLSPHVPCHAKRPCVRPSRNPRLQLEKSAARFAVARQA